MSASPESIEKSFSERLTEFDEKIRAQDDNAELLNEIHSAITLLMAQSGDRDEDIREILEKRYNAGKLRLETFQLVRNVLDRVVIESMPTMPDVVDDADEGDESLAGATALVDRSTGSGGDASQHRLQVGTVLRDRFLLQQRVAGGSMGVVYKAHDRRLAEAEGFDPWVAIKVLSPKLSRNAHALRALQQEAAKGRCLSHPNIVRFIDLDRDDDIYFIVMEWLEGRSLAAILDENRNTRIDLPTALDIVRQVGQALDYAHRCGVIHADVKPANIMLTATGQVKLFDFGIARIRQQQDRIHAFDPGVLGAVTPAYASPQVLRGEDPQTADDVYSLGCLMYRMVAGYRAFGPRNAMEAADQGMEPQRPQGLSDAQWRPLRRALAFSRSDRYASVAEFLQALDAEEQADEPISAMPMNERILVEPKRVPQRGGRSWGIAATLVFVALAGIGALVLLRPDLVESIRADLQSRTRQALDAAGPGREDAAARLEELPAVEEEELPPAREPAFEVLPPGITAGGETEAGAGTPETEPAAPPTAVGDAPAEPPAEVGDAPAELPVEAGDTPADELAAETSAGSSPTARPAGQDAPPAAVLPLGVTGAARAAVALRLDAGAGDAVVELLRQPAGDDRLTVVFEETAFDGERSPREAGRYRLSENVVSFAPGEERARVTLTAFPGERRFEEARATLTVRNVDDPSSELAVLELTLEDAGERAFEAALPPDTVGFTAGRLRVREGDPAVQIDVVRLNPGDAELYVRYFVAGGSATEDEDYFLPGTTGLVFAPGQRTARLLIPLVQDSMAESDETFTLELRDGTDLPEQNLHRRIEVVIRDDDGAF